MTVCNMSIEAGARAGLIAPDDTTFAYLEGRTHAPTGAAWEQALDAWRALRHRRGRRPSTRRSRLDAADLEPLVSWGTNPAQVVPLSGAVPDPDALRRRQRPRVGRPGPRVHGPRPRARPMRDVPVDTVFIGSCTNSRIEDLRAAAAVAEGRTVRAGLRAIVVPGSFQVKDQAEAEGLDAGASAPPASTGASRAARCAWP